MGLLKHIWDYNSGKEIIDLRHGNTKWAIGIEIEKSRCPWGIVSSKRIYKKYGFVLERDSSVPKGFELKTPIYGLFDDYFFDDLKKLRRFVNIRAVKNSGCHINLSNKELTYEEMFKILENWFPIIFALNINRVNNNYCKLYEKNEMKSYPDEKYQAVHKKIIDGQEIMEIRIFTPVRNIKDLKIKIKLLREICKNNNINKSFSEVIAVVLNKNSNIHKLLINHLGNHRFKSLLHNAILLDFIYKLDRQNLYKLNDEMLDIIKKVGFI